MLRDKRRNPSEDRRRVFLGNQQIVQRVSTDTGREHSPGRTPSLNQAPFQRISASYLMELGFFFFLNPTFVLIVLLLFLIKLS